MDFHRRFVTDLIRDDLIPGDLLSSSPELQALEAERRRLAETLEDTKAEAPRRADPATYTRERTRALREGREPPAPPPNAAEYDAARVQHDLDVKAVEEALLALGDEICQTVAAHPDWEDAARRRARASRDEAADLRRRADEAEQRAADAAVVEMWARRVADGELFVPTFQRPADDGDRSHIVIDIQDPAIRDLIEASRAGQPL